ncbi:MAG: hypothetical protein KGL39_42435 [Patescibacteria group bacterium]|nr:hypothetical protein [Patescibacteria group bacterium]
MLVARGIENEKRIAVLEHSSVAIGTLKGSLLALPGLVSMVFMGVMLWKG